MKAKSPKAENKMGKATLHMLIAAISLKFLRGYPESMMS